MKEYNINVYIYTYNIQYIVYMQYTVYIYICIWYALYPFIKVKIKER
jgi:hypothetical protein